MAVFSLGYDRAPGSNGFPIVFFQQFWHMLEDDLHVFFNEFHSNGVLTKELGDSFIDLTLKKEGALGYQTDQFDW